jgi:hypothetical protein
VFTAVAGIVVVVYQRRREKHQELERSHREQMSPIYQQLVETLKDVGEKEDGANVSFFKDLATKMLLYGPTPVVKAWIEWHRTGVSDDPSNLAGMLAWEKVLLRCGRTLDTTTRDSRPETCCASTSTTSMSYCLRGWQTRPRIKGWGSSASRFTRDVEPQAKWS